MNQNRDYRILENINAPEDLKKLSDAELVLLAGEIRDFLIESISKTGGHLGSNLGIVELTLALHKTFDSPKDKIIWDVGHQSYVHKILTGRKDMFSGLRKRGGLSGFTKRTESPHDIFGAGHSSTSLSAAVGIAAANAIMRVDGEYVVAVIGDGSFTGGLVYEALNNSKNCKNFIVILNDNEMSISKNVGSVAEYLAEIRTAEKYYTLKHKTEIALGYLPLIGKSLIKFLKYIKRLLRRSLYNTTFFEQLGFDFLGPVNGHDIKRLLSVLAEAKVRNRPVFIHVKTQKGKGYEKAENSSTEYHSVGKFDADVGIDIEEINNTPSFSLNFGKKICKAAEINLKICAVTAAMTEGTGLSAFREQYPERFFDVGIAEEHAAIFAAGLAAGGLIPVFAVYSSFIQRAYDQILHDVALQKLHVIFCVDRAGFVGEDGATHHGVFDTAFLNHIPGVTVFSPSSYEEFDESFDFAVNKMQSPVVIRYPKGGEDEVFNAKLQDKFSNGNSLRSLDYIYIKEHESDYIIITYGRVSSIAFDVYEKLNEFDKNKGNKTCSFLKLNKIKPLDDEIMEIIKEAGRNIVLIEEGIETGGISEHIAHIAGAGKDIKTYAVKDFVGQGTIEQLFELCGFNAGNIFNELKELKERQSK